MLRIFTAENERLRLVTDPSTLDSKAIWVDLANPTNEEEAAIENWLRVNVPTRDEMEEIEISSRLYSENGAHFMTVTLPAHSDSERNVVGPVTFVLAKNKLVTVRYHEPRAFQTFPMRAEAADLKCNNGQSILVGLLEAIVDRLADLLESVSRDVIDLSREVFHPSESNASKRDIGFQILLRRIGRKEDFLSNIQDSLISLQRLGSYLASVSLDAKQHSELRSRVKTISRDVISLTAHAESLSHKITFLLDATLGMINIQQNAIIKIVSVAAVVFLPPTLVASIYGMNFQAMPELRWAFGYPAALVLMVAAAIVPYWWFKRRGWL